MMLADAIDSAVSEHAVYFLVTAYLESLDQFRASFGIPERVIVLPLGGMDDLNERVQVLRDNSNAPLECIVGIAEALSVLECALARLRLLGQTPEATAAPHTETRQAA